MSSQSAGIGSALPDQTGFSGYILTTDGVTPSWEASSASLPTQVGQSGKYLTTNGTVASWAAVTALPDQTGNNGKFLTTNGTTASWAAGIGGVTTMAAVGSTPSADGASIATDTLTLQPADATHPGVVTAGDQTFGGAKTMAGLVSTVGALVKGQAAAGDASGVMLGVDSDYATPCVWLGATSPTYASATLSTIGGGGIALTTGTGSVYLKSGSTSLVIAGSSSLDCSGMAVGAGIKLRAPGGTTFTATISDGGAWVIS